MKTLTPYYGGKSRSFGKYIASILPAHRIYIEPCGGMGGVLMQKSPSFQEVYNDIDGNIVNLFRVVRDEVNCADLIKKLNLTPYSREERDYCIKNYRSMVDEIEWARMVYVILTMSYTGSLRNSGFSQGGIKYESSPARNFFNSIDRIPNIQQRFKNIVIENKPAMDLCQKWDSPESLFYIDPPYLTETRRTNYDYNCEMKKADHEALLNWCLQAQGKIIISGYESELYKQKLEGAGWITDKKLAKCTVSAMSKTDTGTTDRVECLWFSPNALSQLNHNLFREHSSCA